VVLKKQSFGESLAQDVLVLKTLFAAIF